VVTDATQTDIAIRVPRIGIGVQAARTGVHALVPIAAADERVPANVVHSTETLPALFKPLSPCADHRANLTQFAGGFAHSPSSDQVAFGAMAQQRMDKPDLFIGPVNLALLAAGGGLDNQVSQMPQRVFQPQRIAVALMPWDLVDRRPQASN